MKKSLTKKAEEIPLTMSEDLELNAGPKSLCNLPDLLLYFISIPNLIPNV